MLRKKDSNFNEDSRIAEFMKKLGKEVPEEYKKSLKSLKDSESEGEYFEIVDESVETTDEDTFTPDEE